MLIQMRKQGECATRLRGTLENERGEGSAPAEP